MCHEPQGTKIDWVGANSFPRSDFGRNTRRVIPSPQETEIFPRGLCVTKPIVRPIMKTLMKKGSAMQWSKRWERPALGFARATSLAMLSIIFLGLLVAVPAVAQEPAASRIEHADKEPQNWLTYYGNYS